MINYENACYDFYSKLNLKLLPLYSWEFRQDNYQDVSSYRNLQSNWQSRKDYLQLSMIEDKEMIITNAEFKIVFATQNIARISGYKAHEIIGKSPSMFQGQGTSEATRKKIKMALSKQEPFKEVILNYRKNGDTYWCEIEAFPMFNKNGKLQNYVALERIAS